MNDSDLFEQWYTINAFDYLANQIGSRECSLQRKAFLAGLAHARKEAEADVSEMAKDAARWRATVETEYAKHVAACLDGFAEQLDKTEFMRLYNESFDKITQTD